MIVWLNGPFGVGKSTAAARLAERLGARVVDPERPGWVLQRTVGLLRPGDFQDLRSWRRWTVRWVAHRARSGVVVVPMTVLRAAYLDELLGGLRARGHETRHVLLDVDADTLRARIDADRDDPRASAWRQAHVDAYLAARGHLRTLGPVVDTTRLAPDRVAHAVAAALGPADAG